MCPDPIDIPIDETDLKLVHGRLSGVCLWPTAATGACDSIDPHKL